MYVSVCRQTHCMYYICVCILWMPHDSNVEVWELLTWFLISLVVETPDLQVVLEAVEEMNHFNQGKMLAMLFAR